MALLSFCLFFGLLGGTLTPYFKESDARYRARKIITFVIDVSILRTTLMECGNWVKADLYNGRIVRVANSFVFKEPVYNYSADFPFLWDEIAIPVKYGCDLTLAQKIFEDIAHDVL